VRNLTPVFLAIGLVWLGVASAAFGAVIHVPGDQATIQLGINAAVAGDMVLVAAGTYFEHDLQMKDGIRLRSEAGLANCVTIDARQQGRVLSCHSAGAGTTIEGFTLTGGSVPSGYGGGLYLIASSPSILRCVVTGNWAEPGASGIYCLQSSPVLTDCVVTDNLESVDGCAIYCVNHSSPVFEGCLIARNTAQIWGGAMYAAESTPRFTHCTIQANHAYQGGGIWVCYRSHAILEDTIVASSTDGEGVYVYVDRTHPSVVTLTCCDVFGNQDGNYGGDIEDQTGLNGNISESPVFCDPATGNYRLTWGSPCLPENNSCQVQIGAFGLGCGAPVAAPDGPRLDGPITWHVPNPFSPGQEISFRLSQAGPVSLSFMNASGAVVRGLLPAASGSTGSGRVQWDGRNDAGRVLPSGVYFCRIQAGRQTEVKKTLLLK
jgi:hypothetical protein